jgi:hypothetical protein
VLSFKEVFVARAVVLTADYSPLLYRLSVWVGSYRFVRPLSLCLFVLAAFLVEKTGNTDSPSIGFCNEPLLGYK